MKPQPLPPPSLVRAMRKERRIGTKAGMARRLYAERCSVHEISVAMNWPPQQVRDALRRVA